jgi:hypothetical protein
LLRCSEAARRALLVRLRGQVKQRWPWSDSVRRQVPVRRRRSEGHCCIERFDVVLAQPLRRGAVDRPLVATSVSLESAEDGFSGLVKTPRTRRFAVAASGVGSMHQCRSKHAAVLTRSSAGAVQRADQPTRSRSSTRGGQGVQPKISWRRIQGIAQCKRCRGSALRVAPQGPPRPSPAGDGALRRHGRGAVWLAAHHRWHAFRRNRAGRAWFCKER